MNIINRSSTMNIIDETTKPLVNEPRLEETAIKILAQSEVNNKAKR